MKKTILYFALLVGLWSCSGEQKSETANTDSTSVAPAPLQEEGTAKGEKEEMPTAVGKADEKDGSYVRCKANGQDMEFTFIGSDNIAPSLLDRKEDGTYSRLMFERGSTDQMTEKVTLTIINYDPSKLTLPFKVSRGVQQGKRVELVYQIKIAGMYIPYSNVDDFDLEITSFSGDVVEGKFSGTVTNTAGKAVRIENGTFKIKLKENKMPA